MSSIAISDKKESTPAADAADTGASAIKSHYTCGTLRYTRKTLIALFAWLLWGDLCWGLMEAVVPALLPLELKHQNAPNWVIGFVMITVPAGLNMVFNPWVSFKSDRHRGPRGRRIPFIVWTLPPLAVSLALLGFSSQIGTWVHSLFPMLGSQAAVTIVCIGILIVGFQFFNRFVSSVFYYLFNDVVPHEFMGRFLGLFRVVGSFQAALFNFFIFRYAETHTAAIFVGAAVLYAIGFGIVCFKVKEGEYPPPPENIDKKSGVISSLKTYCCECYSQKYYWNAFLHTACGQMNFLMMAFMVFFRQDIGLSLTQIGIVSGISAVAALLVAYPAGIFADRYNPIRIKLWCYGAQLAVAPLSLLWLFYSPEPQIAFAICIGMEVLTASITLCINAMNYPQDMLVFPREKYGQFASAQALVRSCGEILGGLLIGIFLDTTRALHHGSNFGFRYYPIWIMFWSTLAYWFLLRLYKDYKKYNENVPECCSTKY